LLDFPLVDFELKKNHGPAMKRIIYRERKRVLVADSCAPLARAARRGELRLEAMARGPYPGASLPARALPHLKSVGFWDAQQGQDWGLDWHYNEGIEITYLESGRLGFAVGDEVFSLRPGDLTITRPWQRHRVGGPLVSPGRLYWMILDVGVRRPHQAWSWPEWMILNRDDLRMLSRLLLMGNRPVWPGTREVEVCFQRLGRLIENRENERTLISRLALLINELLVVLLETLYRRTTVAERDSPAAEASTARFLERLEGDLSEPWTLDSMAEGAGLARTRFAYYCHKLKNMTPNEYLRQLRLAEARRLLREQKGMSLTDVGLECGFGSGQYFATVFRRFVGVTPGDFREGRGCRPPSTAIDCNRPQSTAIDPLKKTARFYQA
jgi:AraC family L-rhamnose operon regulatory protein RhaS